MAWFFKGKQKEPEAPARDPEAERQALIQRVYRFLTDEDVQNQMLPQPLQDEVQRAPSVDTVPGGRGDFGREPTNPIPVNGPFGAAQYLSSLVTEDGQPVAFQRLGAINTKVDLFETVSFDGGKWDCLYLSIVFPRKSTLAPAGFRFAERDEKSVLIRGMADNAEDFPFGIYPLVVKFTHRIIGAPVADPRLRAFDGRVITLPDEHRMRLQQIRFGAELQAEPPAS